MNANIIAPALRKMGDVPSGRIIQIAQWSTELLRLMVPNLLPDPDVTQIWRLSDPLPLGLQT